LELFVPFSQSGRGIFVFDRAPTNTEAEGLFECQKPKKGEEAKIRQL